MASISLLVDVNVFRQTGAVTLAGHSLAMFLGKHKGFTTRTKLYSSLDEVAVDFAAASPEYEAAASTFSQVPAVDSFMIGRVDSTTVTYTPVVQNSSTYTVTINGTAFSYISDSSATDAEIVAGLIAAINAGSEPVTASGTSTLILTADVVGVPFSAKGSSNLSPVYGGSETLTDALTAITLENNDWYGLMCYDHSKAAQIELAAFAQASRKLYKTSSSDANIINQSLSADTTSVAKAFKDNSYGRAGVIYSATADTQFIEAGYLGVMFGYEPGSYTMHEKVVRGDTVDNLTSAQIANAASKNATVFVPIAGANQILYPTNGDGTFDDLIRDIDYAASQLQIDVTQLKRNVGKVPFTDIGIGQVVSVIESTMLRMASLGIFDAESIRVTYPKVSEISANDRALRRLTGIKINARVAGAIHFVSIDLIASI